MVSTPSKFLIDSGSINDSEIDGVVDETAYGLDFENNNYESGYDLSIINSDISSYLSNNDEFNYLDSFNSDIFSGEVDYENENVFGFEKPNNNSLSVVEEYSNDLKSIE